MDSNKTSFYMRHVFIFAFAAFLSLMAFAAEPEQVLSELKSKVAPDKRTAVWDVRAETQDGKTVILGTVGTSTQRDVINNVLRMNDITDYDNRVIVLEQTLPESHRNALVKLAVATLRTEPKHSAEVATQAIMGTPLRVLEQSGEWLRVQMPDDYIAYIPESSVTLLNPRGLEWWQDSRRYIVTCQSCRLLLLPESELQISDLVLGNILQFRAQKDNWICLITPDGREGWVKADAVAEFSQWAQQRQDVDLIEKTARDMLGCGYLWGGTSTKVTDCSGLMKVAYFANAIILQRDASQQALTGVKVADWKQAQRGDLLFFGNASTGRVTHVGMYLADGKYIHCSGQVKINSLDPEAPDYLYSPLSISRILGNVGSKGIKSVRNHSWYFIPRIDR